MTYEFLQQYWWAIVSLLGALVVFLMFVQGANALVFFLGRTPGERRLVINSTGRKWEFTFTTLVTFGGAFFASFPLFYSTSFGSAYWVWMLILFTFVVQAVSYEFQNKLGNLLGAKTFQTFLVVNGIAGPLLIGGAVATFFEGSNFVVEKANMLCTAGASVDAQLPTLASPGVISHWANASAGLDVLLNPWVLCLGLAVMFLAQTLGAMYIMNNVDHKEIHRRACKASYACVAAFLVLFVVYAIHLFTKDGFAVDDNGVVFMEPYKYYNNTNSPLFCLITVGLAMFVAGLWRNATVKRNDGIWGTGIGTVLIVFGLLLLAGYNNTAYYPSTADLQSSLTIQNSCSSETTLRAMFYVSLLVPFVLAYIVYAWHKIDARRLTLEEIAEDEAY